MAQSLTLKIKGLYTSPNELSEIPEGALLEAENIVIDNDGEAEPRRGYDRISVALSGTPNKLWFYQNKIFAHHSSASIAFYNTVGPAWTAVPGSYTPPTGTKMRVAESNKNLYFSTNVGIYKLDVYSGTPRRAGAPKALDLQATIPTVATAAWLQNNYRSAYRVIWGYKDSNGNLILGAPSQRESVKNTSGVTKDVSLRFTVPQDIVTDANYANWFYQIYRSSAVDNSSADIEPNDELGLVYEGNPTSTNITNKFVDIVDIVPDALRGATIYTASSQQGLASQNEQPPLCKDIVQFKDRIFYLNTTSKHRFYLTLLSVTGTNGVQVNDTLAIGGVTYTGKASETITSGEFQVVTSGSAAQNIRDTALSLVRVINRYSSSTVNAFYLSGADDYPGKILLEERSLGGSSFACISSRATCWSPALPTSGTTQSSTNDSRPDGFAWSKSGQPEAVPLTNYSGTGRRDQAILRGIALRDSLFLCTDGGISRVSEDGAGGFQVQPFDASAKLLGEETPAVLNNQIFCLTDQGVCTITETGVSVISRPIEDDIKTIFGLNLSTLKSVAFGVGYETGRRYYLFLINSAGDTYPTTVFVYNVFTMAWTSHALSKRCGIVGPRKVTDDSASDLMYLGDGETNYVNIERKAFNYTDYVDFGFDSTITSVAGTAVTLGSGVDNVEVGDVLYQSATVFAIVTAANAITSVVSVQVDAGFSAGAVQVLKGIQTTVTWAPITLSNPAILKQYHTAIILFKADFTGTATLSFATDLSPSDGSVTLTGSGLGLWGLFAWSDTAIWGGDSFRRPYRTWVPRDKQIAGSYIKVKWIHRRGYSGFKLSGMSIFGESTGSENVRR